MQNMQKSIFFIFFKCMHSPLCSWHRDISSFGLTSTWTSSSSRWQSRSCGPSQALSLRLWASRASLSTTTTGTSDWVWVTYGLLLRVTTTIERSVNKRPTRRPGMVGRRRAEFWRLKGQWLPRKNSSLWHLMLCRRWTRSTRICPLCVR